MSDVPAVTTEPVQPVPVPPVPFDFTAARNAFRQAQDTPREPLSVTAWGIPDGVLEVRGMTGATHADWLTDIQAAEEAGQRWGLTPLLLRRCIYFAGTDVRFFDDSISDEEINERASTELERVGRICLRLTNRPDDADEGVLDPAAAGAE